MRSRPGADGPTVSLLIMLIATLSLLFPAHQLFLGEAWGTESGAVSSRDSSRTTTINKLVGPAPTIDGSVLAGEWAWATNVTVGTTAGTVSLVADGTTLFVLLDIYADVTQNLNTSTQSTEYTAIVFDGDGDSRVTYTDADSKKNGVLEDGDNVDWAVIAFGDGTLWESYVQRQLTTLYFPKNADTDVVSVHNFTTSPGHATPHRVTEISIPYDGDRDILGCNHNFPFTKGFNVVAIDNGTVIAQFPTPFASFLSTFETTIFPQLFPHVANIAPADATVYEEGASITFKAFGTDENQSTLQYKLIIDGGTPIDMATTNETSKSDIPVGAHSYKFRVVDDQAHQKDSAQQTFQVINKAVAPVLDSKTPTESSITMKEGDSATFIASFHDDNLGQGVNEKVYANWTVNGLPANVSNVQKVQVDQTHVTSSLRFAPGYQDAKTYDIKCTIMDTYLNKSFSPILVQWSAVVAENNTIPYFLNVLPNPGSRITISEVASATFSVDYGDIDGDPLTIKWLVNDVQKESGVKSFTLNEGPPHYDAAGNYSVKAVVSDGVNSPAMEWNVTISNVNRQPMVDSFKPSESEVEVLEGSSVNFEVEVTDLDGEEPVYIWSVGDVMQPNATGPEFIFRTALLGEGSSGDSPYTVSVKIVDQQFSETVDWTVIVKDNNRPPVPTIIKPSDGDTFSVGKNIQFDGTWTDPDTDHKIQVWWDWGDDSKPTSMGPTGTASHTFTKEGEYKVRFYVEDGTAKDIFAEISLTIEKAQVLITSFDVSPKTNVIEGDAVYINVSLYNKGSNDLSIKLKFLRGSEALKEMDVPLASEETKNLSYSWLATKGSAQLSIELVGTNFKYDKPVPITISVKEKPAEKPTTSGQGLSPILIAGILAAVVVVAIVGILASRSKKKREEEEREADEAARKAAEAKAKAAKEYRPPPEPEKGPSSEFFDKQVNLATRLDEKVSCIKCGTGTHNPSEYCDNCSEELKRSTKTTTCPKCHNEVSSDVFHCPFCNYKFAKSAGEEEALPPPPPQMAVVAKPQGLCCPKCGAAVKDSWTVCPDCDNVLKAEEPKKLRRKQAEEKEEKKRAAASRPAAFAPPATGKAPHAPAPVQAVAGKCPKCGSEVEPDWKMCPDCSTPLDRRPTAAAPKSVAPVGAPPLVLAPAQPPSGGAMMVEKDGKLFCPKCNGEIEEAFKMCPDCGTQLAPPSKKKIMWSKRARRLSDDGTPSGAAGTSSIFKREVLTVTKEEVEAEMAKLEARMKGAEAAGKDIKKAKNLMILAASFHKGAKYDKAVQYIEKAMKEL